MIKPIIQTYILIFFLSNLLSIPVTNLNSQTLDSKAAGKPNSVPKQQSLSSYSADKLATMIEKSRQRWQVPGCSVIIVTPQKVIYLGGHGVREIRTKEKIDADTIFPLASCSKAFTATLLAKLADEGTLLLDDPVQKHLPYFHLSDPVADKLVTLRDLLCHRTGVAGNDLLWYHAPWSQENIIRRVAHLPLSKPFRTAMQYQSILYSAAGTAAGNAAQSTWAELIRDQILQPLEMNHSSLDTNGFSKQKNIASGHHFDSKDQLSSVPWYLIKHPDPAGSINSSASDLGNWLQFQLNEGKFKDNRILSPSLIKETRKPHIVVQLDEDEDKELFPETNVMSYGLGWNIHDYRGQLTVAHSGWIDGFSAHIRFLPKKQIGMAILSNLFASRFNLSIANQLTDELLNLPAMDWDDRYLKIIEFRNTQKREKENRLQKQRLKNTQPSLPLHEIHGTFYDPAYGIVKVRFDQDHLVLSWSSFNSPLIHFQLNSFRLSNDYLDGQFANFLFNRKKELIGLNFLNVNFSKMEFIEVEPRILPNEQEHDSP